jgi:protein-disulfide isomerase
LFENQPHLKLTQLRGYAEQVGLDLARYAAEMEDRLYLQRIREHIQSGRESGVRATPTFFVNRRIQDVSFGLGSLFDAVALMLRD